MKLLTDGHCPVCQGPTQIEVVPVDSHTTTFTCVKHPQFSHRITLPTALPLGYVVVDIFADGEATVRHDVYGTPQEAAEQVDYLRGLYARPDSALPPSKFAVGAVTLIEDPA